MMQDIYVDTVTAINFNNGIVRMTMVDQDPDSLADGVATLPGESHPEPRLRRKQQVIMPLNGFLYMVSVIKGLVDDPKMQQIISRHVEAGLLPGADAAPPAAAE
ncbi:peptide chain release factor 1 [Mangrovicoccus algicola]|uniref:Peptide chain release factor 1 n=1 Tax=Mangrovicoccus algicola TaxID=2771008 RepID=A0A8J6YWC6_9RHOB|nr:peptide chain release factor 1 [Mangrovicoccus algicola]MBE3638827.1 peptide chain release factor 1 [Mangrovicoccus algicola]